MTASPSSQDAMPDLGRMRRMLDRAALAAVRAQGDVEPNPLVGCVIARGDEVIGIGHHHRFGGPHAEREALADCRRRGHDPRGATLYCTLEPCRHHGKQPPCTDAVIESGVARVVYARPDPGPESGGGDRVLCDAGIESVCVTDASPLAVRLSDPFVHRVRTGRPWVIAKWAQTLDGRIATRSGESQWITGPRMRRRVHRLRACVDAVVVGVGTVLADDPMLTPRDVRRVRRAPARVVLDSQGRTPLDSALVRSASEHPTVIVTTGITHAFPDPVRVIRVPGASAGVEPRAAIEAVGRELGAATILVEAGPRVLGSLLEADLIDEAFVHIAPMVLGDEHAMGVAVGRDSPWLADARRFAVLRTRCIGGDVEIWCRRAESMRP